MTEQLQDELVSIDAIYGSGTLYSIGNDLSVAILTLPSRPEISTRIRFPSDYPKSRPSVLGPESTGQDVAKGEGQQLARLIESVLPEVWSPGEPCIFALIEECTARLSSSKASEAQCKEDVPDKDEPLIDHRDNANSATGNAEATALDMNAISPDWTLSEVVIEKKSVFVARVASVASPAQAKEYVLHLLATDKKAARATHNITAWRIKGGDNGVQYQDCDDDGETAAGGRLLHLLELVDAWNVMVVVTRWYGGVHLGPDRFRLINQVARDALVNAGFVDSSSSNKKKGKK